MTIGNANESHRKGSIFEFDFIIFFSMLGLMTFGVLFIYSSGVNSSGQLISNEHIHQIIWIVTALIIYFLLQIPKYESLRKAALKIYLLNIFLLGITLIFGKEVNGARSWLGVFGFGIQPSEFMKISLILMLAAFFHMRRKEIAKKSTFFGALGITLLPMIFVVLQPDLGTSMVFMPIFIAMSFMAGVDKKSLLVLLFYGLLTVSLTIIPVLEIYIFENDIRLVELLSDKNLVTLSAGLFLSAAVLSYLSYRFTKRSFFIPISIFLVVTGASLFTSFFVRSFMKDYQIMRLIVFIRPEVDPRGSGWNIIQSLTAVGSGGMWGKGFLQGTQSHYQFLPQQSTDFIFSILAEEWGFVGALLVLLLFFVLFLRGFFILLHAGDDFGVYAGTGILFLLFFHLVINIGMTIGIMPITGIPLFFLSYGGSSLWSATIGMAIIQNIYLKRYKY
jgi:rod shape determining protein RodA